MDKKPTPSKAFSRLGTETAFAVLARAKALESEGKSIINLGIGQPDMPPPRHAVEACMKALKDGHHGYTPSCGLPELREAAADHFNRIYDLAMKVIPSRVMIVPGGKMTMFQAIMLMGESGYEIAYPNPGFPIYGSMVHFTGATAAPYRLRAADNFRPNVEEVLKVINERTRLLILNNPSNPTGGLMEAAEVDRLAEALKDFPHVTILSDEIYSRLVFGGQAYRSLLSYDWLRERLIVLDGWSKSYAMTGWRVGMSIWPESLFDHAERLVVNSYSCVNTPAQWGALAALTGPQDSVKAMCEVFQQRRDFLYKTISQMEGVECNFPEGAFYAFLDVGKAGLGRANEAQDFLLEKMGVALISGESFGPDNENFLRISFAASDEAIAEGLERIGDAIKRRG